jgi:hypothetical protein
MEMAVLLPTIEHQSRLTFRSDFARRDGMIIQGGWQSLFGGRRRLRGTNSLSLSVKRGILWGKLIPALTRSCDQTALNIICL